VNDPTDSAPPSATKDDLQGIAFLSRCLADVNRLRILRALGGGKKAVSALVEELDLSQPLVSHHLKELRRALLVTVDRRGPFVYYQVADQRVHRIMQELEKLATDLLARRKHF